MKIFILILFVFCFIYLPAHSKEPHSEFFHNFTYGMALSYGPENIIAVIPPKLSVYYYKPVSNIDFYCGVEASAWVMMSYFATTALTAGVKSNVFTFDTSLSYLYYPRQTDFDFNTDGPFSYISLNPKIGLKLGWFWFKFGPGILLHKGFNNENTNFREMKYNYEISMNIPFKIPNQKKINEFNHLNR